MKSRLREREVKLLVHEDVADGGVMQRGSELKLPLDCGDGKLKSGGNELHNAGLSGLLKVQQSRAI